VWKSYGGLIFLHLLLKSLDEAGCLGLRLVATDHGQVSLKPLCPETRLAKSAELLVLAFYRGVRESAPVPLNDPYLGASLHYHHA